MSVQGVVAYSGIILFSMEDTGVFMRVRVYAGGKGGGS
jgi:hypothetical protein